MKKIKIGGLMFAEIQRLDFNMGAGSDYFNMIMAKRQVTDGKGSFLISDTMVTVDCYKQTINADPMSREGIRQIYKEEQDFFKDALTISSRSPLIYMRYGEAMDFCHAFSQKFGVSARLPSDIEWEFSCRGGTTTRFFWGNSELKEVVSRYACAPVRPRLPSERPRLRCVGEYEPNQFGLYDMSGLCSEYVLDRAEVLISQVVKEEEVTVDTVAWNYVAHDGVAAIIRNGGWMEHGEYLLSSSTKRAFPDEAATSRTSFRMVIDQ
jgi:formylglycine-generating enzyme required for sulfatase activity